MLKQSEMTAKIKPHQSFILPLKAVGFIFKNRSVWHYAIVPMIINVVTFLVLGIWSGIFLFNKLEGWFITGDAWYIAALVIFLKIIAVIVLTVAIIFLITMMANIFSAPFNEMLSRKTEELILGPQAKEKITVKLLAGDIKRTIIEETIKFFLFGLAQVIIFLLNFIPQPIGLFLYIIAASVLNFYLFCFQYMDYSMARRHISFKKRWQIIFSQKLSSFTFGGAVGIGMFIPLVNMVYIPVCVVAGTMLYLKHESPQ